MQAVLRFLKSEDGPTAVEYAVMVALVIVALLLIITAMTNAISGTFSKISSALS
jgi:pilus assembly protein Flp/PilA